MRPPFRFKQGGFDAYRQPGKDSHQCGRWKTDYIIIKRDEQKHEKRAHKLLYKFQQISPEIVKKEISKEREKRREDSLRVQTPNGQGFIKTGKVGSIFMNNSDEILAWNKHKHN